MRRVRDEIGSAAEFLQAHIQGSVRVKGSQIQIEGAEHQEVKLLLHKFLHLRRLEGYKVHAQPGFIEIVPPEKNESHEESKGRPPTAPETMPYFFPGRTADLRGEKCRFARPRISLSTHAQSSKA